MKSRWWAVIGVFPVLAVCSCSSALSETQVVVASKAQAVNGEFVAVRQAEETLVAGIASLYDQLASLDLSTQGMDEAQGGLYATFPGGKYYYKTKASGSALYVSPGKAVGEDLRRQVKFLEHVDPLLQKAARATDVQTTAFYGVREPLSIALMSPWFDVVSRLPPAMDLNAFEWYQRGWKSPGPPVWSVQPFTDLSTGWVMDVSAPVKALGKTQGVTVISVDLAKLAAKHFHGEKSALVLMGSDTTVVGLSPRAEGLLGISALESVDYLTQVKENSFASGKYRLGDPSQPPEIQQLAQGILQNTEDFAVTLGGRSYDVVQEVLAENGMRVVGFSPR